MKVVKNKKNLLKISKEFNNALKEILGKIKKVLPEIPRVISQKTGVRTLFLIIGLIVIFASIGSSIFFYRQYNKISKTQQTFTEIEQIVKKVSLLMELPKGETPTLATVSDKTKLQNQSFFQNAENGDRILVYSGAKRAILYRPSTNKIIDVAPIMPLAEAEVAGESTTAGSIASKSLVKIAIYNGSGLPGLASLTEEKLKENVEIGSRIQIVAKEYAQKQYQGVLVIDLAGNQNQICQQISQFLSGKVVSLPTGEKTPDAQILVILGKQ